MVAFAKKNAKNEDKILPRTYENFIRVNVEAAQEGHPLKWIAQQFGLEITQVQAKRAYLRNRGVVLPKLNRGRESTKVDADELNDLIKQLVGEDTPVTSASQRRNRASFATA